MLKKGVIVKNISNSYVVNTPDGDYTCTPRGIFRLQKITPLVGDNVDIEADTNTITNIYPRSNYCDRPSVANIDYALIVTSVKEPNLSLGLLDRLIVRFESKKIKPIICFTKLDLLTKEELKHVKSIMKYYKNIGYKVVTNKNLLMLKFTLRNKIVFLVGQTGAGKSSLINKLDPNLNLDTSPISKALGRGVHTTRHTELYKISNFYIVDTPGFSAIDITDIKKEDIKKYFKEFDYYNCEYKDCNHDKELCEVKKAVNDNKIMKSRYDSYIKFYKENYESSSKLYK